PLEVVCDLAGVQGGVRVHAWLNVLSGWPATSAEACAGLVPSATGVPDHLLLRHPDATLVDERGKPMPCPNETDYIWVSPRHLAVSAELEQVVTELVERYPLAGVHLDRIRYPGRPWHDRADDVRRVEAVTAVVRSIRTCVPGELELTASLVPDYGSGNGAMPDHLAEYGQDGWRWVEEGLLDSVMPMVYTPIAPGAPDDWGLLVGQHRRGTGGDRCWIPVFAGLDTTMVARQAEQARRWATIGIAWYSAGLVGQHDRWDLLRQQSFG
ncbi:MAG TPA: hypothetical protein VD789_04770, partial [Thermomicrobiales bacterium]|nr:hypothetical protein [Thermomicrobiales bacterium]